MNKLQTRETRGAAAPSSVQSPEPLSSRRLSSRGVSGMDATLEKKLTRLQNRRTRYEIVVECIEDGTKYLLVYADRWTRRMAVDMCGIRANELQIATGVQPTDWKWGESVKHPITGKAEDGKMWQIRKSGRTQRDAYILGELPWITGTE